jgi:TolB protein
MGRWGDESRIDAVMTAGLLDKRGGGSYCVGLGTQLEGTAVARPMSTCIRRVEFYQPEREVVMFSRRSLSMFVIVLPLFLCIFPVQWVSGFDSPSGTIAYVRGSIEIRLIDPDGKNDRRLWTHPDINKDMGLFDLAWRPDGTELAFSSGHAAVASLYHADLYGIRRDGSGLRKLTNSPDRSEYDKYPKGTVTVVVRNDQPAYRQAQSSSGVFFLYVAGADLPQQITLPPGSSKTVVFKNVADFGKHAQPVVAIFGSYRWFIPGVDVQAGRAVTAPPFSILGDGIEYLGAFRPVWKSDGSRISYRSGMCTLSSVPTNAPAGEYIYNPLFGGKNPPGTCSWDWGPTPNLANQIIYSENDSGDSSIYQIAEGGTQGQKLVPFSNIEYQLLFDLRWLPDGSGFLFSNVTLMRDSSNISMYKFATKRTTPITRFPAEFVKKFSISPDGQYVVFERAKSREDDSGADLWICRTDGSDLRLLVRNGESPSWGR